MHRLAQHAGGLAGQVRRPGSLPQFGSLPSSAPARAFGKGPAEGSSRGVLHLAAACTGPDRACASQPRIASGRAALGTRRRQPMSELLRRYARESGATSQSYDHLPPNMPILDDTPPSGVFPLQEEELLSLAKKVHAAGNGVKDPSLLAENFRFEFPLVKIDKKTFLKALGTFKFDQTFPDVQEAAYHWRVDPYEPHRVWWTTRSKGTHKNTLNFGGMKFYATKKEYRTAPQSMSYTFNSEGKVTSFTGGYVMDGRVGNGGNLGGLFGVMKGVGLPVPGSPQFFFAQIFTRLSDVINFFTLGIWNKLLRRE